MPSRKIRGRGTKNERQFNPRPASPPFDDFFPAPQETPEMAITGRGRSRARPPQGGGGPLGKASRPRAEKHAAPPATGQRGRLRDGAPAELAQQGVDGQPLLQDREHQGQGHLPARLQQPNSSSSTRLHAGGAAVRGPRNRINFLLLLVCHWQAVRPVPPVHSAQSVQSVQAAGGSPAWCATRGGKGIFAPPPVCTSKRRTTAAS